MLKNITPGFYKMRNGRLSCIKATYENKAYGYAQTQNGIEGDIRWDAETGKNISYGGQREYDLMERIE